MLRPAAGTDSQRSRTEPLPYSRHSASSKRFRPMRGMVEDRGAGAEHRRREGQDDLVQPACRQRLAGDVPAAADPDPLVAGGGDPVKGRGDVALNARDGGAGGVGGGSAGGQLPSWERSQIGRPRCGRS